MELDEHFAGDDLDPAVWVPYYLPHWSSRASSAPTYAVAGGELRLSIPRTEEWSALRLEREVRRVVQAPDYPVQLELGVFDFPDKAIEDTLPHTPELIVSHVIGHPLR